MLLGETIINGITSFLFIVDGKLTGYQIRGWKRYPLDASVFNELRKLYLTSNNKIIEENVYKVILDLETGYKHYFKNNKEDLAMFYKMNGEDRTLYQGKDKNTLRRKIGYTIFISLSTFTMCLTMDSILNSSSNRKYDYIAYEETEFSDDEIILPISIDEMSKYILSSTNLNDEEKSFLNNQQFFDELLPYINKNPKLIEMLRYKLSNIDIQKMDSNSDFAGYNDGSQILHVNGYEEERLDDFKSTVAHEFCHDFQCESEDFNYLMEATNEILAAEYFDQPIDSYTKQVKVVKCLMEIIGVEPILESHLCEDSSYLHDSLTPYLSEEEIALFHIDKGINHYTAEERSVRFEQLIAILEKLYYGKYGESMWDNSMIASIMNDWPYERYYFNRNKIQSTEMYASYCEEREYTIEEAVALGYVHPYIMNIKKVSLEEWLQYDGSKQISCCSSYRGQFFDYKYYRIVNDDGSYTDIPIEEAIEAGYISQVECSISYKEPTDNLNQPYIKYDLEDNCRIEEDKIIVTFYEKEYYSPTQQSVSVLNQQG